MGIKHLAVIPARSGSKGLPDKNIRDLCGKPLMVYSIEAALEAGIYDTVHVSTDSEQYAAIAREYGADVPFLRSAELASDTASTWDTMKHVIKEYEKADRKYDTITVLQPTSPLRTAQDIIDAMQFFEDKQANMISSVCKMEHSPLWSNTLPENLSMENFEDESIAGLPRQALPIYYRENGAIYIVRVEHLFGAQYLYKDKCYAYIMAGDHSVDIDEALDFQIARTLMEGTQYEK